MMWSDRIALGLLELFLIVIVLLLAINYFSSALPLTEDSLYGLFIGGAVLVIIPLWLVLRIAERRGRRR
jgi:hypothetical protein